MSSPDRGDAWFTPRPRSGSIAVVFVSRGRPAVLAQSVAALRLQSRQPDQVIVSCTCEADIRGLDRRDGVTVLLGTSGMTAQRNRGLAAVADDIEFVVFFDDDFVPRADWIAVVERTFVLWPDVGSVTGHVVADGVKGPGLSFDDARRLIATHQDAAEWVQDGYVPYGCNMAFRRAAIAGLWFDERLVSYAWLEDRDFGAALARRGWRIIKISRAVGVHLGVKAGRSPGRQLGYSQIVNPVYLHRKGTMPLTAVADHIFRNAASNVARFIVPEQHIDRRGRLRGNLRGLLDLIRGRLSPERATSL